jgi:hypothetical protein
MKGNAPAIQSAWAAQNVQMGVHLPALQPIAHFSGGVFPSQGHENLACAAFHRFGQALLAGRRSLRRPA